LLALCAAHVYEVRSNYYCIQRSSFHGFRNSRHRVVVGLPTTGWRLCAAAAFRKTFSIRTSRHRCAKPRVGCSVIWRKCCPLHYNGGVVLRGRYGIQFYYFDDLYSIVGTALNSTALFVGTMLISSWRLCARHFISARPAAVAQNRALAVRCFLFRFYVFKCFSVFIFPFVNSVYVFSH